MNYYQMHQPKAKPFLSNPSLMFSWFTFTILPEDTNFPMLWFIHGLFGFGMAGSPTLLAPHLHLVLEPLVFYI